MSRGTPSPGEPAPIVQARRGEAPPAVDDRLNQQIQAALRQGAETRDERDRAHSIEDDRANERESAALQGLIDGHRRSGTR